MDVFGMDVGGIAECQNLGLIFGIQKLPETNLATNKSNIYSKLAAGELSEFGNTL
jgi:hypothetical protein